MRSLCLFRSSLIGATVLLLSFVVNAQEVRHEIHFPDLPGYQTLKCDFHMHTVFSDGNVWPTVRVEEAWRQGLDAIAITDHLEYQPKSSDLPTNHNRPYELAKPAADACSLILIRGSEITRDTPPGHFNGIFLSDSRPLDTPEFFDAVKAANDQNAFVFWNHQGWKGEEKGRWMEVHTTLFEASMFQGMEVDNNNSYFPTAHRWCLEKGLTLLGNSDIHSPDLIVENRSDHHRTMTLVFAAERTAESIHEALRDRRTVVWGQGHLIGRQEHLEPLFDAAVSVTQPIVRMGKQVTLQIRNQCEAEIVLDRSAGNGPQSIKLSPCATTLVTFRTPDSETPLELHYTASNLLIAPETGLPVTLTTEASSTDL
ncbi:PHP domain-containing protein [Novipirellula artificiosorum]|uniref:Polymerase/histidinol phosphatase N-terminal domain-containing protein n=1 Tax=Novipirellula artificiosorum TaxID=2528016 RepID=A0A5C6DA18_9BACT|nr:PHP domain-containing protein [Novipirellula artificiosorum]TWU33730.1 hypothetical protein Poly41_47260 [Novipirellula artificiosorum]